MHATDPKDGKDGKAGTNGTNGLPGRGIADSQCTADGLMVTYTDGTTTNAGQCRGADGTNGTDGEDWACPEGTSLQETTVMTSPTESAVIYACR